MGIPGLGRVPLRALILYTCSEWQELTQVLQQFGGEVATWSLTVWLQNHILTTPLCLEVVPVRWTPWPALLTTLPAGELTSS